jgi:hypothetical protein
MRSCWPYSSFRVCVERGFYPSDWIGPDDGGDDRGERATESNKAPFGVLPTGGAVKLVGRQSASHPTRPCPVRYSLHFDRLLSESCHTTIGQRQPIPSVLHGAIERVVPQRRSSLDQGGPGQGTSPHSSVVVTRHAADPTFAKSAPAVIPCQQTRPHAAKCQS